MTRIYLFDVLHFIDFTFRRFCLKKPYLRKCQHSFPVRIAMSTPVRFPVHLASSSNAYLGNNSAYSKTSSTTALPLAHADESPVGSRATFRAF